MLTIEYIILILLYTSLTISLIFQWLCYKKKMENLETIAFTSSLLLLVISISISPLLPEEDTTNVYTLFCMVLIAVTTFLDTWSQQKHTIPAVFRKVHVGIAIVLVVSLFAAKLYENMSLVQNVIVGYLIISVVVSMVVNQQTAPIKQFKHFEKSNKVFAFAFFILVPTYLIIHYFFEKELGQFQIGFLLYFAFIALAVRKISDDLQRLSLINNKLDLKEQKFENYGLTPREKEIAMFLLKGVTYQEIADSLFISLPTVKTHSSKIYKKCSVKSRTELIYLLTS